MCIDVSKSLLFVLVDDELLFAILSIDIDELLLFVGVFNLSVLVEGFMCLDVSKSLLFVEVVKFDVNKCLRFIVFAVLFIDVDKSLLFVGVFNLFVLVEVLVCIDVSESLLFVLVEAFICIDVTKSLLFVEVVDFVESLFLVSMLIAISLLLSISSFIFDFVVST